MWFEIYATVALLALSLLALSLRSVRTVSLHEPRGTTNWQISVTKERQTRKEEEEAIEQILLYLAQAQCNLRYEG